MSGQPHCITVALDEHHYEAAEEAANKLPVYRGSHRGEEANIIGCLGEIVFMEHLTQQGVGYREDFTTTHDITITGSGRLDIKTKDRKGPPKAFYDASVPLYNHEHQDVAYWGFVSLERGEPTCGQPDCSLLAEGHPFGGSDIANTCDHDLVPPRYVKSFSKAHLVGVANRSILDRFGTIWKAGQTDPSNGTKFWTDCINLAITTLKPIREATQIWKERQER